MPRALSPSQFLVASFAGLSLFGGFLLWLPVAAEPGQTISFLDALFTSTSAVCVTGLIVVDTPNAFSTVGEVTLMLLIFVGGLGYMTLSTVLVAALGRKLSLQERSTLQEALKVDTREGMVRFAATVLRVALAMELGGAALLTLRFSSEFGLGRGAYLGLFHAVSAFNNAGFSLWSDNLTRYRGDVTVNLVITGLIICGGLGFFVLRELSERKRFTMWSLHTKLAIVITGFLLAGRDHPHSRVRVEQPQNPRTPAPGREAPGELVPVGVAPDGGVQHHRHRRHDRALAVPDHDVDVHRRVAGQHGRRRQDDYVRHHGVRADLHRAGRRARPWRSSGASSMRPSPGRSSSR